MLFLLRNIRRKMLGNNKIATYILYAIGEIFLVVVGILIAVSIDDWNEKQKTQAAEENFFNNILIDLEKDSTKLAFYKYFHEKRTTYLDTLLTYVRDPTREMGLEKFGKYAETIYYTLYVTYYSTTFESAKASGTFNSFKENEILKDLTQYYADYRLLESNTASLTRFVEEQYEPMMFELPEGYMTEETGSLVINEEDLSDFYEKISAVTDKRNIDHDYKKILRDPKMENYLIGDMGRTYNILGKITAKQKSLESIKMSIKETYSIN